MGIVARVRGWFERASPPPWFWEQLAASQAGFGIVNQTIKGTEEEISGSFVGLVQQAYMSNAVVFAVEQARLQLFMQARFQFQRMRNGRPSELYGLPSLERLEHPWPTAVTGDLLTRMLVDADFGGTAFNVLSSGTIRRLRPDWVTMVLGSEREPDVQAGDSNADVLGVIYHPGGKNSGRPVETFLREFVSIFAPIPDPLAAFRGMPWLMPVLREISSDKMLTEHKISFLTNGATPNLVVSLSPDLKQAESPAAFKEWIDQFEKQNPAARGGFEKFKTMYLAGGMTVSRVGSDMGSTGTDLRNIQAAGETRIAAAGGVPPVIVGLSEGLQAATYSNYGQARRRFADNTMRPLWQNAAASLETLVPPPPGSRLWYDDRDIQALAEDKKDLAEVRNLETQQFRTLVDSGWEPESVKKAVITGDWTQLVHTGLYSVQLQPPMPDGPPAPTITTPDVKQLASGRDEQRDMWNALLTVASRQQPAPSITVTPPDVHVAAPDMRQIEDLARAVRSLSEREVAAPIVNIAGLSVEPPVVNVAPPEVHVDAPVIHIDPLSDETIRALTTPAPAPVVTVHTPAELSVHILSEPPSRKRTKVTKRNNVGQVDETTTEDF